MTKYLIYYSNQDSYEGQNQPFAIVNTKSRAEKIVKEIRTFGENLANQMLYAYEQEISHEEYIKRSEDNDKLLTQKWPYGWEPSFYSDFESLGYNEDGPEKMKFIIWTVEFKELPVL